MQKKWELNFKKILANTEEIRYNMEAKLNIKKELKEIEEFLKSNKVGNIVIERKPNGTITIQKTETSQYKKRVCE